MKASAEIKSNKLSRRKKARARRSLETVTDSLVTQVGSDPFLRNHLFSRRAENNRLIIGKYLIHKNSKGLFDVYEKKQLIYSDLYVFDAAMAIVESLNSNRARFVEQILEAEEVYSRNINDLRVFSYLIAKNSETRYVLEDRLLIVKERAREALDKIKTFRVVNS